METSRRRDLLNSVRQSDEETRLQMVMELDSSPPDLAYPILQEIANSDSSARVRYTARRALERLRQHSGSGDSGAEPIALVRALDDEDAAARSKAVVELAATGNSHHLGAIIDRLALESEVKVIASLLLAVGRLGSSRELSLLAGYTDHTNPRVRANVIEALYALNTPVALPLVMPFLTDSDNRVRANAAIALRRVGKDRAIKVLKKMVVSPHLWMRASAAYALGLFDPALAMPLLKICQNDPSSKVRARAERALNRIARHQARKSAKHSAAYAKKSGAVPGPVDIEKDDSTPSAGGIANPGQPGELEWSSPIPVPQVELPAIAPGEPEVAPAAAVAAAETVAEGSGMRDVDEVINRQDRKRLARLVADLEREEDRFVTARVLSAIGILEEQGFTDTLVHHLRHPDSRVAANAVWALTRLGDVSCRDEVLPLLNSMQPRLRANALLYFATDPTVDLHVPLKEMLCSRDVQSRMSGLFCLAEMERPDLLSLIDEMTWSPEDQEIRALLRERLLELERRGLPQARSVRDRLAAARATRPVDRSAEPPSIPVPPPAATEPVAAPPQPKSDITMPGWQYYLVICRVLATLTDFAVAIVPMLLGLICLSRLAGGLPPGLATFGLCVSLGAFLCRDIPNGPGVGKRLLGLTVRTHSPGNPLRYILRQLPVLLFPWGLLELWGATRDPRGQRTTDTKLHLLVMPAGDPQLGLFFCLWLVMGALGTAVYGAINLHGQGVDPLWSDTHESTPDIRTSPGGPSDGPLILASASATATAPSSAESPAPGDIPTPPSPRKPPGPPVNRFDHVSIGLSVPIPKGWSLVASGSSYAELQPARDSPVTTGDLILFVPSENEELAQPSEWSATLAQHCKLALRESGTPLTFWVPVAARAQVGGRTGTLYRGESLGGGSVLAFGRDDGQLGVLCRVVSGVPAEQPDVLLDGFVHNLKQVSAARDWRHYHSPFHHLSLDIPMRWQVERDDIHDITLRASADTESRWIRLDPDHGVAGNRPDWAQVRARMQAVRLSSVSNQRYERVAESELKVPAHPKALAVAWKLRDTEGDSAQLSVAWLPEPDRVWVEEWEEPASEGTSVDLQTVLASLHKHDI